MTNLKQQFSRTYEKAFVWDAHSCLPLKTGIDLSPLERHHKAGINYVSINVGMDFNPWTDCIRFLAYFRGWIREHHNHYMLIERFEDLALAKKTGRLGITFDLEGSVMLDKDFDMLSLYYDLGVRQIHFAYNRDNEAAGGCHGYDINLTPYGRQLVTAVNKVGMIMDCSHTGYRSSMEIMEISKKPVVFSHANCYTLKPHPRNIRDDQIDLCAKTGGVIGVNGIGIFLSDKPASAETMVPHIDYLVQRVGAQHVGIGLDFSFIRGIDDNPPNFEPALWWPPEAGYGKGMTYAPPESFPAIAEALAKKGYAETDIMAILGGNFLRVAQQSWV